MSEHKKRISKNALKILFEIICEDSFEGKGIKSQLPAARRISKSKEALWEYIRGELERRSDEHYDLATLSAGWYYNLRKAETSFDKLDLSETPEVAIQKMEPMERYVIENLANRRRGENQVGIEEEQDVKLNADQLVRLSRRSTSTKSNHNPGELRTVKNERKSSNDGERKISAAKTKSRETLHDPATPEAPLDSLHDMTTELVENAPPSRYHSARSSHVSRNNSTMSVSGYDADNEKGLIKRRRKELKTRAERQNDIKIEEEEEDGENVKKTEEEKNEEEERNEEEENEEMMEMEDEERGEGSERERIIGNLKGMIENLADHILSLRIIGAIDTADMESLADSFENAAKSVSNNKDTS